MAPRRSRLRASSLKVEERDAALARIASNSGWMRRHRAAAVAVHEAQVHAVAGQLVGGGEAEAARAAEDQRPRTFRQRNRHRDVLASSVTGPARRRERRHRAGNPRPKRLR